MSIATISRQVHRHLTAPLPSAAIPSPLSSRPARGAALVGAAPSAPLPQPTGPAVAPRPPARRADAGPERLRRAAADGVGEPRGPDPAPHGRGLRQLRPRRLHPRAGVGQARRRHRAAHLLLGAPRQRLRLALTSRWYEEAREQVALLRRCPRGRRGRLHPQHHRLVQPARPRACPAARRRSSSSPSTTPRCCRGTPRRTVRLPVPGSVEDALILLEHALAEAPAGPRLVVVAGASNVTGELWPIERIVNDSPSGMAPASPWTPPSSPRTRRSTSTPSASTTSPSRATSSTPRSEPASSPGGRTGSTRLRHTCVVAARPRR